MTNEKPLWYKVGDQTHTAESAPILVEHYPTDKRFEELLGCVPELSPELKKINNDLEDEKLYHLIERLNERIRVSVGGTTKGLIKVQGPGIVGPARSHVKRKAEIK